MKTTLNRLLDFFDIVDENGISNLDKVHKYQKVLRRVETTDKSKSVEETGEWQQSYYAYPNKGLRFDGWYENGGIQFCRKKAASA